MVSPFLWLAVELQCDIIGRLLGSEDLKAVCLVSKHVAAIAAPFLYNDIVLDGNTAPIGRLTTIIKSLSESKNLGFARTLTIRNVVQDSVDAMDLLLPQLGELSYPIPTEIPNLQANGTHMGSLEEDTESSLSPIPRNESLDRVSG